MTCAVRPSGVQSVENVSGQKPACMTRSTMSHRRWPVRPLPTSNQTPRRRAASTSGRMRPLSSTMLFGGGANMCVTMSPGLSRSMSLRQRRDRLAHVDHHRQIEGGDDLLRAPQHLVVVGAGDVARQPRLDADDDVAVLRDGVARRADIGAAEVHGVAVGQDAGAPDVDQHAARLRRRPGDGRRLLDAIGALRSRIDEPGDAVREAERRAVLDAGGVACGCRAGPGRRSCRAHRWSRRRRRRCWPRRPRCGRRRWPRRGSRRA